MKRVLCFLVVLLVLGAARRLSSPLVLLSPSQVASSGARCLDGSPPGFYVFSNTSSTQWVIFLQGGGWCYDESQCVHRSQTSLGSSRFFPSASSGQGMLFDDDPSVNPFASFNKIYVPYCDGGSFAGDVQQPVVIGGTPIYFRGKRIITAIIENLIADYQLNQATDVLLSGCSAGGLANYINADYVGSLLPPSVKRFKSAPVSGFFLDVPTLGGDMLYPSEMRYVYKMQNISANAGCVAANAADPALCMFAEANYPFIKTPLFIQNSMYDSWQLGNVFVPGNQSWNSCIGSVAKCTVAQIQILNSQWQVEFVRRIVQPDIFWKPSTGAFLHSLISHCSGLELWNNLTISGVSVSQAWWRWFNDLDTTNRHIGCTLHETPPFQCSE